MVQAGLGAAPHNYWAEFFKASIETYKGFTLAQRDGLWWRWDGWQIGMAATEADSKRAIDILKGDV